MDPRDGVESLIGRKDISNELILVELWTNEVGANRTVCHDPSQIKQRRIKNSQLK